MKKKYLVELTMDLEHEYQRLAEKLIKEKDYKKLEELTSCMRSLRFWLTTFEKFLD